MNSENETLKEIKKNSDFYLLYNLKYNKLLNGENSRKFIGDITFKKNINSNTDYFRIFYIKIFDNSYYIQCLKKSDCLNEVKNLTQIEMLDFNYCPFIFNENINNYCKKCNTSFFKIEIDDLYEIKKTLHFYRKKYIKEYSEIFPQKNNFHSQFKENYNYIRLHRLSKLINKLIYIIKNQK